MNVNDIHIGDTLITKEGNKLKITDFYPLCNDDGDYRIVLSSNIDAKDWFDEHIWIGQLNNLHQHFIQINDRLIDIPNEVIIEECNALRKEIKELKRMVKELLDK